MNNMQEKTSFQERFLLTLDSDDTSKLIRSMLKSPLGLSHKVVKCLFNDEFDKIRENFIKEYGIRFLRFKNSDIQNNLIQVLENILSACKEYEKKF